jgi:hypothetical protein
MLQRLRDIGFRKVGEWEFSAGELMCSLVAEAESRNILYAFESKGEVLYIGKTTQPLKTRMYGYQNPSPTQSTNIKNNENIKEILSSGNDVSILALPDHGLLHYGGFHLNLAAGLEDNIVFQIKPKWNKTGI